MIYSKNDISKFYSKVVKENLEYGNINIPSMRGSQGADSSIDIDLGGRIRRVLIETKYDINIDDVIIIKVIDFKDTGSNLYWNDKGDLVQIFYFIPVRGTSHSKYYMVNSSELALIMAKMKMRRDAKNKLIVWTNLDSKYYPIFKKVVQSFNKPGWKRFDVKSVSIRAYDSKKYYMVKKTNGETFFLQRTGSKFYLN